MSERGASQRIAIYIHIPFCRRKCGYCDFYSLPYAEAPAKAFLEALEREMEDYQGIKGKTLYLGGGTPTILPPSYLKEIISTARDIFLLPEDAEVTVEGNPESLSEEVLEALRSVGVNRLSIGIQSFKEEILRFLGRAHTAEEGRRAVKRAREFGFGNLNIDLIYGIPGQTVEDWQTTLEEAVSLQPTHISCYALTFEEGTPLGKALEEGKVEALDDDVVGEMYDVAVDRLERAGYIHYEISNFAIPGYQCKHNLSYWRAEPYLGLGPSAVSYLPPNRFRNPPLEDYIKGEEPKIEEVVKGKERSKEKLLLGLRLEEGVEVRGKLREARIVKELASEGYLKIEGRRIKLTRKGMLVYNSILGILLLRLD